MDLRWRRRRLNMPLAHEHAVETNSAIEATRWFVILITYTTYTEGFPQLSASFG